MKQKVAVLIINFKGLADTLACLDSLTQVKKPEQLAVYVANYQSKAHEAALAAHSMKPKVVTYLDNVGFAGFNNRLVKLAQADGFTNFILLNNDTTVAPDFVQPLVARLHEGPALISPKIYFYPGNEFHLDSYDASQRGKVLWYAGGVIDWQHMLAFHRGVDEVDRGQFDVNIETDFATGCCLAFTSEVIERLGLMDERFFMYLEDVDWSLRTKKAGIHVLYEPQSNVWHKNASSSGGAGSDFHQYYQQRNRVWLAMRQAPLRTRLAVVKQGLRSDQLVQRQATQDALVGKLGYRKL